MSRRDFLQEYMEEVREHLQELESSLLVLEREGNNKEEIGRIFRAAHSIKGASSYMGFEGLAHLTHDLESLIGEIQVHSRPITAKGVNLLLECVDFISRALGNLETYKEELPLPPSLLIDLHNALSMKAESAAAQPDSKAEPRDRPSLAIVPKNEKMDGPCREEKRGEAATGISAQRPEEARENELAHIGPFLKSFRDEFWELVNTFALSSERVLSEPDFERAHELIKRLANLSAQPNLDEIVEILQEWESVLCESHRRGQDERDSYSDLLNMYGQRLQEVLPSLELPFLNFDSEGAHQSGDGTKTAEEEEEEDSELLSIFTDTFQRNFSELLSLTPPSPEEILSETDLVRAREIIKRLISSAHYMDYGQVVNLLKECEISLFESDLSRQMEGWFYSDLVKAFGRRLQDVLPILRLSLPAVPSEEKREPDGTVFEEEDDELLGIFLDSFQQNFAELLSLSPPFPENVLSGENLERARELIKRSVSSARYMDYGHVVDALKEWDESLVESIESGQVSGQFYSELLNIHGQRLQVLLPALQITPPAQAEDEEDKELVDIFLASFEQNLSELVSLAPPLPEAVLSGAGFERAGELFKRSISSAHYMGYDQMVNALKDWEQSLRTSWSGGTANGRMYSEMLGKYERNLQEMMGALKTRFVSSTPSGNGESAVHVDHNTSDQFIENTEEPPLLSLGSIAEDISRELGSDSDETITPPAERRLRESPQSPEQQTKKEERTAVTGKEGGAIATLRVNVQKVDQLLNQVMELVVRRSEFMDTTASFMSILREFTSLGKLSKEDLRQLRAIGLRLNESTLSLGRVASDMQNSVMRVRMLPISQLFMRFPRVVRDQALKMGKKVELVIEGGETEIDKHVLEQMYDPLVQFLRNAIVHGIESPTERRLAGKPELGIIRLSAYQEGDYVVLVIDDDGRGIDTHKLGGILKQHSEMSSHEVDRLSNEELIQAIFLPGISTHGMVDGTAGRGVGLDVVKENVERMNGTIEVESEPGVGARFTVRIPLTVAIIRALLVKGVNQVFALPLNAISQILRYRHEDTHTIEGFQVIQQRGKTVPLVRLSQLLGVRDERKESNGSFIVVVTTAFREVGLIVEGLRGEREIVIKPIEDELHTFEGFSGATILGDGTISLILDVSGLLRSMKNRLGMPGRNYSPSLH